MINDKNTHTHPAPEIVHDEDFIVVYRGLERELCNAVIAQFNSDQYKWRGKLGRKEDHSIYQEETKSSWDLEILNDGEWKNLFQQIHPQIHACMADYLSRSPVLKSFPLQVTGYKIQMYPKKEGYFRWHADSLGRNARNRVAAMVLYLNDVEQGGQTEFFHQNLKIEPKAGNLLLFPAGWNYMHCGHTPESHDKYIISSFIKIND
ncbi:2OG-Fe(II) oxygenase family protein [Cellvibrio mixtus]|uniref:2OG-Fe(II) oxygenase family protein n=1 Tax=Cellvibrio mixtus TaxID=39650 RepID=UPI00069465E7|nr:2OG-Fe(II) oxygenase [Cellvibrio mixtus]